MSTKHHIVPLDRIQAPPLTEEHTEKMDMLRELVLAQLQTEHSAFYESLLMEQGLDQEASESERAQLMQRLLTLYAQLCTPNFLHRYLRARAYDVDRACTKVLKSLQWHAIFRPEQIRALEFEEEARTGKIYLGGLDVHGRPVVVLDNTKVSVLDHAGQIRHLVWILDRAVRRMSGECEKFAVFIHLEDFAFTTAPSLRITQETVQILGGHFPERLGHCVLYKAPFIFWSLYNMVKPLIDPVTKEKVVMISGDTSDGSANDQLLIDVLGPDWKKLCGAGQPVLAPGASPGYDHDAKWAEALQEESEYLRASLSTLSLAQPATPSPKGSAGPPVTADGTELAMR